MTLYTKTVCGTLVCVQTASIRKGGENSFGGRFERNVGKIPEALTPDKSTAETVELASAAGSSRILRLQSDRLLCLSRHFYEIAIIVFHYRGGVFEER